ncbi:MAG: amidohydrolase/deacetylase family metallohydrolase [Acidobacteria bacterium]|nr:amidohydrolase/deacetylase family metallohydrolase [Acidobacteriota bacterium]
MKLALLLVLTGALGAQQYDLLLRNGHVIDAKNRINAVRDIAIRDGRIAAVGQGIAASSARRAVDATGLYVTPGLIDIHVHVYAGTGMRNAYTGDWSVYPDGHAFRSGVTTMVDAGTSGWRNFPDFRDRVIDRARTRILALINIAGRGMGGANEQDNTDMDSQSTANMVLQHKDVAVGIKTAHYRGPEWVAVDRGIEAARLANVPLMVDFGDFRSERPFQELVTKKLRPGDMYTHTYLGAVPMIDDNGKLMPYLLEARKRGVLFDAGHGGGSFLFRQAVPAIRQGFAPDSISTDLHVSSMNAGMKDMTNVMSKFLNIGVSLEDVIAKSTWAPARQIKREELGHLSVGAVADVSVLRVEKGSFGFVDVNGARMKGAQRIVAELTVRDGMVVWDLNGITRDDWDKLPKRYESQSDAAWDGTLGGGRRRR